MKPETMISKIRDAEQRFEKALTDLQELGCEPSEFAQSGIARKLYLALLNVRTNAEYWPAEGSDDNYTPEETEGGIEWGPGHFSTWMSNTHAVLEEYRETVADADGL